MPCVGVFGLHVRPTGAAPVSQFALAKASHCPAPVHVFDPSQLGGSRWTVAGLCDDAVMNIRPARADDAGEVVGVWLRSRAASVPEIPPPVHADHEVLAFFETVVLPERDVWVVDDGNVVVALLVLEDDWIDQLYVDPGHTGSGLGSRLIAVAKEQRPHTLKLWTFEANTRARRFYERHGFIETGSTAGDNEERAPDVRYEWSP